MKFPINLKEYKKDWHDYFVWFPQLLMDSSTGNRYFVWLETVRCRRRYYETGRPYWQYKLKYKHEK